LEFQAFRGFFFLTEIHNISSNFPSTTETLENQGFPLFYGWLDVVR